MDGLRLERVPFEHPDAVALVAEVQAEYVVRYGGPDETPLEADVFAPGAGAFFVGYLDEVAVAMGGWRFRTDVQALGRTRAAEIKRMYVAPGARRRGLARRVLRHLEETARDEGADLLVLETGSRQPEAIALYESAGYEPVTRFGYYADSEHARYLGRRL